MIFLLADLIVSESSFISGRAVALYGVVAVGAVLSIIWKQEIGLYLLTLLLPLQTTRYHLHAFPLGANIVDILILCSIVGAILRPAPASSHKSQIPSFLVLMSVFYYVSLWRGAFFLNTSMPLWFNDARLVDFKNFMVMPLLAMTASLVIQTRRQITIVLLLCCCTSVAVDFSYFKSSAGRDFDHYSEETRDAGPLGYAGENGLASYVVEITGFLLPLLVLKRHHVTRTLLAALLVANTCCILFSYSREAYVALSVSLTFVSVLRLRWFIVPLLLVAIAWQTVLPVAVQERMTMTYRHSDETQAVQLDSSAQERIMLWTDAMYLFHENPIFGSGFLTYANMHRVGSYRDTHNFYLKILVETGLLGLLLFIVQLLLFFREGLLLFRRANDPLLSLLGLGFATLILTAVIVNVFGDRWLFIQVDSNLWILLGCVLSAAALVQMKSGSLPVVT